MKILGKELTFNGNKVYHAGDKPTPAEIGAASSTHNHQASQVTFTDGKTFQQKLDDGSLKGPKGDTGATGPKGDTGAQGTQGVKGDTGAKGNIGTSMRFKGAWSSTTAYVADANYIDIVTSGGNTYRCKSSHTNQAVTNTTYWELIAQKGANGATGAQGPQGPAGAKGADGLTTSVTVGSTKYTHSNGNITIPAYPTALKNPTALTLQFNGTTNKTYDGSSAQTLNITPAAIGAAASSHTHNYAGSSSAGGAANSATVLATARTINGTSFNGSANITTANWGTARTITIGSTGKSVNGSGNVSWSLSEIGAAAASHSHSYLPLSGGTITGSLTIGDAVLNPYSYSAAKGLSISAIQVKLQGSYGINLESNTAITGTLDMTSNMTMGGTKFYIKSGTNYSASYFPQLTGSNIYNPSAQIILETNNSTGRFHFLNANGQPGICFSGGFTVKTALAAYSTANLLNNKENAFDIINNFNIIEQNDSRVIVPNIQTCSNLNEDDNIETNYSKIEVNNDGDAIVTTNLNSMVALLIDCVKELKSEIDSLKENLPNSL